MRVGAFRARVRQVAGLAILVGLPAGVDAQDVGFQGASLAGAGPRVGIPTPTASKPESKLWHHDGSWWGSLWSAGARAYRIHRLDPATHAWVDTGVGVDERPDSHCDALRDGQRLYIATHEFAHGPGSPGELLLLLRYSYIAGAYVLNPGYPVTIGDAATETLVLGKDSTGTLWAVWKQALRVYFSHSLGEDTLWSAPAVLPGCTSDFTTDDICSLIPFGGNRIGVMWSDHNRNSYLFTSHVDGQPDTSWSPVETALAEWNDHINLAADSAGRVLAAVKTATNEVKLLVRGSTGWSQFLIGDRTTGLTRAILLLDEVDRRVHVFATSAGAIQQKSSSLDSIAFAPGVGTTVIRDADGSVNNVTATKQHVDAATGIVVLTSNESVTGTYWHHEVAGVPTSNGLVHAAIEPGVAGMYNVFTVTGATPGRMVGFYVGLNPGSSSISTPQCPAGVTIGIGFPFRRFGLVRADAAGVATLRSFVSASAAGKVYRFQAVESFSCRASNRVDEGM